MTAPLKEQSLYHLMRDYMAVMGTSRTTVIALQAYINAIQRVDCEDKELKPLILSLNRVINHAEPKNVSLWHLIREFETEMAPHFNTPKDQLKNRAVDILTRKLKRFETDTRNLTERCAECIHSGDFIIVSSPTGYIRNALILAHAHLERSFRILVLKQDLPRTRDIVEALDHHEIPYELIPQYNLSHYLASATKLFISAVSVTSDNKAITGLGTAGAVSICHAHQVPVYMFVESLKFSQTPLSGQHIYKTEKKHVESEVVFHVTTFSNDFVDLNQVDHMITEKGEY